MRWGVEQVTRLSADRVLEIIQTESTRMGYAVEILQSDELSVHLKTRFTSLRSSFRALPLRLPMDVYWEVRSQGPDTVIYTDPRITGLHLAALIFSILLFAICYLIGVEILFQDFVAASIAEIILKIFVLCVSFVLLFNSTFLLFGGSTDRLPSLKQIRFEAVSVGSSLSRYKHNVHVRYVAVLAFYVIFVILFIFKPIAGELYNSLFTKTLASPASFLILTLVLLALTLLGVAIRIVVTSGFDRRIMPGLAGILMAFCIMVILCAQFPWKIAATTFTPDKIMMLNMARTYYLDQVSDIEYAQHKQLSPDALAELADRFEKVRLLAWFAVFGPILFFVLAIFFCISAIHYILESYPYFYQVMKGFDQTWNLQVEQQSKIITKIRASFVLLWCLYAVLLALVGSWLISTTLDLIYHGYGILSPYLVTIDTSVFMASLALKISDNSMPLKLVAYVLWAFYLSFCWSLWILSIGSFFVQRFFFRKKEGVGADRAAQLRNRVAAIWSEHSTLPSPGIILSSDAFPVARAQHTGFFSSQAVIELSTGCVDNLAEEELDAVLAHELGHCLARHCFWDDLIRFIGRCTFVGDGFARMLQNTLRYEEQADRIAVDTFDINPDVLIRALRDFTNLQRKVHSLQIIEQLRGYGLHVSPDDSRDDIEESIVFHYKRLPLRKRLLLGSKYFILQYLGIKHSGYWHPTLAHRISLLNQMRDQRAAQDNEKG